MSAIVNDFSVHVATANGSGSQSANMVLLRSLFYMGLPVSGKNLFPSNIAGLPTWFTIRVSKDGYVARKRDIDVLIVMNQDTAAEDYATVKAGALVIAHDKLNLGEERDDVLTYRVPFDALVKDISDKAKLRKYLVNMVYVGVMAELTGISEESIHKAIDIQFSSKVKAAELNKKCVAAGTQFAKDNPVADVPVKVEQLDLTDGQIIVEGNAAAGLGLAFGGLTVLPWYPITPSSSVCDAAMEYFKKYRHDEDGKATYAILQAEDELASIGMVVGAGWAGARALTTTSGPGLSLMSEFIGLAYYAEVPAVIWNVQRVGPSTGLPTRTCQGDITAAYNNSHGDTGHIVLFPHSVDDCFHMARTCLDLAEEFQTPVIVLSDLDLGMNYWISQPFKFNEEKLKRGKVLTKETLDQIEDWGRYKDIDGDGIAYRTVPGTDHAKAAFFTRGSGHNEYARYSERPEDYVKNMDRLKRKHNTARDRVPQPVIETEEDARIGLVAFGTSHHAIVEARDKLAADGLKTNYLRLRALPLNQVTTDFINSCDRVYVVEQNRDGQMLDLLRLHLKGVGGDKMHSILNYDGLPLDAQTIIEGVAGCEKVEAN